MFAGTGVVVFLINLLCSLVPCMPRYKTPEIMEPRSNYELIKNLEKQHTQPIVKTNSGILEGYHMVSTEGRKFFAFEGIPFGETTAGENRWKPPIPKRPWGGVRQAKKPGPPCLQMSIAELLRVIGSEDCLFINIFTPNLPRNNSVHESYPVVVFLHGGAYVFGKGSEYGPAYMLNNDVVLVTVNYRLGILGFLSTFDNNLPGNYGLLDQALALKFVHENIEKFGGNPRNVSLMGHSAGAVAVQLHLISNKTRKYFSTAVSCSGTAFLHWGLQTREGMRNLSEKLGSRFRCHIENTTKFAQCMRQINPSILAAAQLQLYDWLPYPPILFSPVVEHEHPDAFLTVHPEEAYRKGDLAKIPYIFGEAKDEGINSINMIILLMKIYPMRTMWDQLSPTILQYENESEEFKAVLTKRVKEYYMNKTSPRWAPLETFGKIITDRFFLFGIIKGLQAHATVSKNTYFYQFSFTGGRNSMANYVGVKASQWGVGHSDDIFYFFNSTTVYDGYKQSDPEAELSSIMIKLLVNFAKTGEPIWTSESGEVFKIWEPIDNPSIVKALKFDKEVEMIPLSDEEISRMHFWNNIGLNDTRFWIIPEYFRKNHVNNDYLNYLNSTHR